mmetsp:Transcript_27707/g.38545  ORF Transcript_27707/g.38545 Transcript_27707/m.38545 type:complete len:247 (+) Transcript_27707:485-1225(+)
MANIIMRTVSIRIVNLNQNFSLFNPLWAPTEHVYINIELLPIGVQIIVNGFRLVNLEPLSFFRSLTDRFYSLASIINSKGFITHLCKISHKPFGFFFLVFLILCGFCCVSSSSRIGMLCKEKEKRVAFSSKILVVEFDTRKTHCVHLGTKRALLRRVPSLRWIHGPLGRISTLGGISTLGRISSLWRVSSLRGISTSLRWIHGTLWGRATLRRIHGSLWGRLLLTAGRWLLRHVVFCSALFVKHKK